MTCVSVRQQAHDGRDDKPYQNADQHDFQNQEIGVVILGPDDVGLAVPVAARQSGRISKAFQHLIHRRFVLGGAFEHVVYESPQLHFDIRPLIFGQAANDVIDIAVDRGAGAGCCAHDDSSSNRRVTCAAICVH